MSEKVSEKKTTIKVSQETREKLLALKIAWDLKTLEDVVEKLIKICGERCKKVIDAYIEYRDKLMHAAEGLEEY